MRLISCGIIRVRFYEVLDGSVVGEKFVRGIEYATENNIPFISVAASGGARMQEGLMSLMQMAKTTAALKKLDEKKIPYISILTDPTMGGFLLALLSWLMS